ncbi:MAG: hypothetical protein LAP38_01905 [Acidobacteriia bacterium]|nr:hypothetical protein [Terriglobia bacterium]
MFPASVYRTPKFPEETVASPKPRKRILRFRKKRSAEVKTASDLRKRLDTTIFRLLVTARSTAQFEELRRELFPEYIEMSEAISTIWRVINKSRDEVAIANAAFAGLSKFLEADTHLLAPHAGAKDEALFCLSSLHRAHFLAQDVLENIRQSRLPRSSLKEYQSAISSEWWSLLHLECIVFAIAHRITPTDDVFYALMEGFRHSVMSYAFARSVIDPQYIADYEKIDFESIGKDLEQEYASS